MINILAPLHILSYYNHIHKNYVM